MPCTTESGQDYRVELSQEGLTVKVGGVAVAVKVTPTSSGYMYEIDGAGMNPAGAKIEFFDGGDLIFECDIV